MAARGVQVLSCHSNPVPRQARCGVAPPEANPSIPASASRIVVLPAPFGSSMVTSRPGSTVRETSRTTTEPRRATEQRVQPQACRHDTAPMSPR